jgi:hypothetical protein
MLEMIINSVIVLIRTELEGKTATKVYIILRNRYS